MRSHQVLITGGAGYIGSHTVLAFADSGHRVIVLDDLSTGSRSALPAAVPFVQGDVGDPEVLSSLFHEWPVDTVVHLAGCAAAADSFRDPVKFFRNNVCASRILFESCAAHHVRRIILSSSAAVYGRAKQNPVPETAPLAPESPYGASKALAELILDDAASAHGLQYACLRYFNVVGADPENRVAAPKSESGHLFDRIAATVAGRRPYTEIYGSDYDTPDGTCVRDYIHVADLAALHLATLSQLSRARNNLILNCGTGRGHSVGEVVRAFERSSGVKIETRPGPRRQGDVAALVADVSSLEQCLGWRPRFGDLMAMVATTLAREIDGAGAKFRDADTRIGSRP